MIYFLVLFLIFLVLFFILLKRKNIDIWFVEYLQGLVQRRSKHTGPTHIMFCFVDHYEPQWHVKDNIQVERERVDTWMLRYPELCHSHFDADGKYPQHTFFYPEEEYREEHLAKLTELCKSGYGEVEIHLHHDNDNSENLRNTLSNFAKLLHDKHGLLTKFPETNEIAYAFIHGNWCLDNSRKDGRWCGVNDELIVLKETGCYADFTLPSAPSETQTKKINSIYYAKDDPVKPKSHNTGVNVCVGGESWGDLMIIQGPLALNWEQRKLGFMPKIESGDIRSSVPPSNHRVDLWVNAGVHVKGRPEWVFVKVHTHGTQEQDMETLLGKEADAMFSYLESHYNDGEKFVLHYVTARETYNIIKAAESGLDGNPNQYRDFILKRPLYI